MKLITSMKQLTLLVWLTLYCLAPTGLPGHEIMLPQIYRDNIEVGGWLMSEKLDGVRGYWDGKQLFSKNGNLFHPPPAFTRDLPPFPLEGELWGGRGTFEQTISIVKKHSPHDGWLKNIRFAIFDVPQEPGTFIQRIAKASNWFSNHPSQFAFVIHQKRVKDADHLKQELERIEIAGGEGLIVRKPDALYDAGRSDEILKVKSFFDREAIVIEHLPGKGRHQGRLGSLLVAFPEDSSIRFKIGTGFSDAQRSKPPPIGALITFKYYGFYKSGIPKFPSFLRVRSAGWVGRTPDSQEINNLSF